jgi:hypothetical protein
MIEIPVFLEMGFGNPIYVGGKNQQKCSFRIGSRRVKNGV